MTTDALRHAPAAADRIVRRLALRAPSDAAAQRLKLLLDDALRCASLPDVGERILLVRRLVLPAVPADAPSQRLSLGIERALVAAGRVWVHGGAPAAARSDAVWFASLFDAVRCRALALAEGSPVVLQAWFWPLALPAGCIAGTPAAQLEALRVALADAGGGEASVAALVAALDRAGLRGWIQRMVSPARWAASGAAVAAAPAAARRAAVVATDAVAAPPQPVRGPAPVAGQDAAPAGPDDSAERGAGAGQAAAWAGEPRPATPVPGRASSHAVGAASGSPPLASDAPDLDRGRVGPSPADPASAAAAAAAAITAPSRRVAAAPPGKESSRHAGSPAHVGSLAEPSPRAIQPVVAVGDRWPIAPEPEGWRTAAAGALFLVHPLAWLGIAECDNAPALVGELLALLGQRLGLPAEDGLFVLAATLAAAGPATPVLEAADAGLWLRRCRRLLRRDAGIGLASLALRPGSIAAGPAHLDLHLPMSAVDLRIRRAGLDIDPGWLPWLGQVWRFHYLDGVALEWPR